MHQSRRTLPKIWLMTDERNDRLLEKAIGRLPLGSGIVFRHYHLSPTERQIRFAEIRSLTRRQSHILMLADHPSLARQWGADGVHGRQWNRRDTTRLLHSAPVHNAAEIRQAKSNGADLFFLSPVFATRSHPDAKTLNGLQLIRLVNQCDGPVILLGGMDHKRFQSCAHLQAYGWAAISALSK